MSSGIRLRDFARSVRVNGIATRIAVANVASLNPAALTFCIDARVESNPATTSSLIAKSTSGSWNDGWGCWLNGTSLTFWKNLFSGGERVIATFASTFRWRQIVGSFDGTTMRLYVDGVLAGSTVSAVAITASATPLNIGGDPGNTAICALARPRMWNRALNAGEIMALYRDDVTPSSGLVLDLPLTEGAGTSTADLSGAGNVATLSAATLWHADVPQRLRRNLIVIPERAVISTATSSTGVSGGSTIGPIAGGSATLEMVARIVGGQSADGSIGGLHDGTAFPLLIFDLVSNHLRVFIRNGAGALVAGAPSIPVSLFGQSAAKQWVTLHTVLDASTGTIRTYVNGQPVTNDVTAWNLNVAGNMHVHKTNGWDNATIGNAVGRQKLWTRPLSAAEVLDRYNRDRDDAAMRLSLAAEYLFREGQGTTVADSSGNGRTMTLTSMSWTTG